MNWAQFRAIVWLRYRLSRNQFIRAGKLNATLSIFLIVLLVLGSVGIAITGFALGPLAGAKATPGILLLIFDGILFFFLVAWMSGLMVELQRSESIDLDRLLSLPISLRQVFVFNYSASLLSTSIILFLPGTIGFCLGLLLGAGAKMALLLPLVLSFVFMITTWTYCLRGWLAALMVNKRRRRAVTIWVTAAFILLSQLPNILVHSRIFRPAQGSKSARSQKWTKDNLPPQRVVELHRFVPLGWVGYGAFELKHGNAWPALTATAAGCLIGLLGLMRAYRLTLRFYTAVDTGGKVQAGGAPVKREPPARPATPLLVERKLPFLPDDIAGLALATFRSLSRAPELKMALVMPVIFGAVGAAIFLSKIKGPVSWPLAEMSATLSVIMASFFLAPTMGNIFGLDRDGFRALILLPARRHHILFAKNLGFFPFVAFTAAVLAIVVAVLTRASLSALLTALVGIPACFLLLSLPCNLASILAPYRLAQGSLKAKKPKALVVIVMLLNMVVEPMVAAPILIPSAVQLLFSYNRWLPWLPVNLLIALVILPFCVGLYWLLIEPLGQLLQRREQLILREVTEEVE